jgi:hypothetical protein
MLVIDQKIAAGLLLHFKQRLHGMSKWHPNGPHMMTSRGAETALSLGGLGSTHRWMASRWPSGCLSPFLKRMQPTLSIRCPSRLKGKQERPLDSSRHMVRGRFSEISHFRSIHAISKFNISSVETIRRLF